MILCGVHLHQLIWGRENIFAWRKSGGRLVSSAGLVNYYDRDHRAIHISPIAVIVATVDRGGSLRAQRHLLILCLQCGPDDILLRRDGVVPFPGSAVTEDHSRDALMALTHDEAL